MYTRGLCSVAAVAFLLVILDCIHSESKILKYDEMFFLSLKLVKIEGNILTD